MTHSTMFQRLNVAHVLLVDDDPAFTEDATKALAERGLDAEVAIDSAAAVVSLTAHLPDLVCVDLNLPRESGYEICELIRGDPALKDLPIVIISNRHLPEDLAYAEEAGANAFVILPVSPEAFARQVESVLDGRTPSARSRATLRELRPTDRPPG
ncbi:MAG: response regulator [Byssovorax sp.]